MGNFISGYSHQFKDLRLFGTSCTKGDSSKESDFATAPPWDAGVEEQIERSKYHWSMLADHLGDTDEEEVDFAVSNQQEFKALQRHPTWGHFFANFTGDGISTGVHLPDYGELVVGKKFAEGGQAELFEAQIKWNDLWDVEIKRSDVHEFVLKVFKEGTLLKHVKCQLPKGLLRDYVETVENTMSRTPERFPQYTSQVYHGILLKGGRFAFLMQKLHFDMRTLIEHNMKLRSEDSGPFSKEEAEYLMYRVALGVEWLHNRDIVHRDLKASNILVHELMNGWPRWWCYVADYECSIGVVGTGFFRAPEILQACTEKKVNERPEVFSRAADVYSFGMICYEILTGKLPFEDHPLKGSFLIDRVTNQHLRPEVPIYIEDWTRELLFGCWKLNPTARPKIGEILNILSTNSSEVKRFENERKETYGKNFRS